MPETTPHEKAEKYAKQYVSGALRYGNDRESMECFLRAAYLAGYQAGKRNEAQKHKSLKWYCPNPGGENA